MKDLLLFAHNGEAQSFLKSKKFKGLNFPFDFAYESDDSFLIIAGEGTESALAKCSLFLGAFYKQISNAYNFGVCGSLDKNLKIDSVVQIRTIYRQKETSKMEFKSFHCEGTLDIISTEDRILDEEEAKKLINFAPLVDRESWAMAYACKLFKIKFKSFKLISDYANSSEVCHIVKDKAAFYSDLLLNNYKSFTKEIESSHTNQNELFINPNFYFSTTQKRLLNNYLKTLNLKTSDLKLKPYEIIDTSPKNRTKKLLADLHLKLNPFMQQVYVKLETQLKIAKKNNLLFSFDKDLESESFKIAKEISNKRDLEIFIENLNTLPYEDIINTLRGNIND